MRLTGLSIIVSSAAAVVAIGAFAGAASAAIIVGNTGVSGSLTAVAGNESGSFSFDNNGEFLLVTVAGEAGGNVGAGVNPATVSVSFNGDALTLIGFGTNSNDGFAGLWYLNDPDLGNHALNFNFNQEAFTGAASVDSTWQFGAIGLSNVDEADPIAGAYGVGVSTTNQSFVIAPNVSQSFDPGDFVALADSDQGVTTVGNHFRTTTNGQSTLYSLAEGNAYASIHQVLTSGDIDISGNVPMTDVNNGNKYYARGVVLNAIPEPASLALLGFGGLLLTRRRW